MARAGSCAQLRAPGQPSPSRVGDEGAETAVAVLKVNQAIEAQTRLAFKPDDFKA